MIGKNIYEVRKKRGITLSDLAEKAGISKSYLSNIERNINQNPSVQVIERLALVLDVDLKILLSAKTNEGENDEIEKKWLDFVCELKKAGVDKERIREYKVLFEFIKWRNELI